MELISMPSNGGLRKWRKRGYSRLSPTNKRSVKVVRFGPKRSWRLRVTPKLRLIRLASPMKLWHKFKNAYVNMMLRIGNASNSSIASNGFGAKRIPRAGDTPMAHSRTEFEQRLVFEIYKNMVASFELGYNK